MSGSDNSARRYITVDGEHEVVDLGAAIRSRQDRDPVAFAMLAILSSGPNKRPEDYGFVHHEEASVVFRVRVEVNGRTVLFSDIVDRLYAHWDDDVRRAARKLLSAEKDGAMGKMLDDLEAVRQFMRERMPEAFEDE